MITREIKLKLNKTQEQQLQDWLWNLTGVYNWAVKKIGADAKDKIYHSKMSFQNLLAGHGQKIEIPSHVIQGTLTTAWMAWSRCFKRLANAPHLKSVRNKLNTIPFPDPIKPAKGNRIGVPGIGSVKFHKQTLPNGKIKCGRISKRVSGWYLTLFMDAVTTFAVEDTYDTVGIDTGFKSLVVTSDAEIFNNPRNYVKGQERLAQAQRGRCKKLVSRLHERTANRRKDHNHKVARDIVIRYKNIAITNDNLKGQAHIFGKSVGDAGIAQLRQFILYKGDNHGRVVKLINSKNTTRMCNACGALTGPTGLAGLSVRAWVCSECGSHNDRDINAAINIRNLGFGTNLEQRHLCVVA